MSRRLGVGFVGSGFITRFHVQSWLAVRDADVRGIWSPNRAHALDTAALARKLRVGEAKAFASLAEMVKAPEIDAIWICGPNHKRIENMEERTERKFRETFKRFHTSHGDNRVKGAMVADETVGSQMRAIKIRRRDTRRAVCVI